MNRDMSSPMDASLSTRNQGQLISQQTSVTTTKRVGDMREVALDKSKIRPVERSPEFAVRPAREGLSDISITGLGTTTLKWVGVSAIGGIILWHMLTSGRRTRQRMARQKAREAVRNI